MRLPARTISWHWCARASRPVADIHIQAQNIIRLRDRMSRLIAEHTSQPIETILTDWDRDRWYEPDEALAYGMIDQVIAHRRDIAA